MRRGSPRYLAAKGTPMRECKRISRTNGNRDIGVLHGVAMSLSRSLLPLRLCLHLRPRPWSQPLVLQEVSPPLQLDSSSRTYSTSSAADYPSPPLQSRYPPRELPRAILHESSIRGHVAAGTSTSPHDARLGETSTSATSPRTYAELSGWLHAQNAYFSTLVPPHPHGPVHGVVR